MLISPLDVAFIHFMAALCHHVNINVCLEGVECEEKFDCLRLMGLVSWREACASGCFRMIVLWKFDNLSGYNKIKNHHIYIFIIHQYVFEIVQ